MKLLQKDDVGDSDGGGGGADLTGLEQNCPCCAGE